MSFLSTSFLKDPMCNQVLVVAIVNDNCYSSFQGEGPDQSQARDEIRARGRRDVGWPRMISSTLIIEHRKVL